MNSTTVRDLLRLALPLGSFLLTGVEGLNYSIQDAINVMLFAILPVLHSGEFLVVDNPAALRNLALRLRDGPDVALAVIGDVPEDVLELIESERLPLLQLPSSSVPDTVVREVMRLIDEPEFQIERRAAQLYSECTGSIARGDGIDGVLKALRAATGRGIAFYDATGELAASLMANVEHTIPARLADQLSANEWIVKSIRHTDQHSGTTPVMYGYITLYGPDLDDWDEAAVEQAADALLLELSKQRTIQAIETRAGSQLLSNILHRLPADSAILQEQARELGYDLSLPHVALMIVPADSSVSIDSIDECLVQELRHRQTHALRSSHDGALLCFYPTDEQLERPKALLKAVNRHLAIESGISEPATTAAGWSTARREAEQALILGRHLYGPRHLTQFADVRLYNLLYELRASPDLWTFYHRWLDTLIEHDRTHDTSLLETLDGYFAAQGNLSLAADRLHIHRNTVIRRLRRVGELTGVSLDHTEDALALQVALQAHRVILLQE